VRVVFLSWRDLAHPQAGGSEVLVDRLASGLVGRGHAAALICAAPAAPRAYPVRTAGGTYSQYLAAPAIHARHYRGWDVAVDVSNGIPFFSPLWRRGPVLCFVHHIHRDQWRQRFGPGVARAGWFLERSVVPRVYRRHLFATLSASTAAGLVELGVPERAIRVLPVGVDLAEPDRFGGTSAEPLFLALGRLVPHKRIDLLLRAWPRVHTAVGGRFVVAGDGPDRGRLQRSLPAGAELVGAVSEEHKARLLEQAWLLVHGAMHEGWGMVATEAAAAGTPVLAFDVPGVRDAVDDGRTGVLVDTEDELVERWIELAGDEARRHALGREARDRAEGATWDRTLDAFLDTCREVVAAGVRT
jgi:glycosyltransferase involved in cell wall biosynthesis